MQPTQGSIFYYESLPQDDKEAFTFLEAIVQSPEKWSENEWIDFKNGCDGNEREHWSKVLSAFANSGGGVIVWGIQTKSADKHDIPSNLALVTNPKELEGRLKNWLASTVEPPVIGVQTRALSNTENEGFVVAYIPPSGHRPHRALHANKWYYLRVGHQCEPANTAILRNLFYPQFEPILEFKPHIDLPSGSDTATIRFLIKNRGITTIDDLFAVIQDDNEYLVIIKVEVGDDFKIEADNQYVVNLSSKVPLHPRMQTRICTIPVPLYSHLSLTCFARNMKPFSWEIIGNEENRMFDVKQVDDSETSGTIITRP